MFQRVILKIPRVYLIFIILFSTVGCDQASKAIARDAISVVGSLEYFNTTVRLEHAENPGAFLSMGARLPEKVRTFIFSGLVAIFLFLFGLYLFAVPSRFLPTFSMSMIFAGGVGNLIDRCYKGTVTDFIILKTDYMSTGIFNIADVAIVVGVLTLLTIEVGKESLPRFLLLRNPKV